MVKVLVYPVGKAPQTQEVNGLAEMQGVVGGPIQYVDLGAITQIPELHGYDLFLNEEGKLTGLPLNAVCLTDQLMGDFFISKANEEGESVSLTKEDIEKVVYQLESSDAVVFSSDIKNFRTMLRNL